MRPASEGGGANLGESISNVKENLRARKMPGDVEDFQHVVRRLIDPFERLWRDFWFNHVPLTSLSQYDSDCHPILNLGDYAGAAARRDVVVRRRVSVDGVKVLSSVKLWNGHIDWKMSPVAFEWIPVSSFTFQCKWMEARLKIKQATETGG